MKKTDPNGPGRPELRTGGSLAAHVMSLGAMTAFYIPSHKLDDPRYFQPAGERGAAGVVAIRPDSVTARSSIHEFLIHHYRAYTQTPTPVKGYWTNLSQDLIHDVMERFEVSFGSESEFDRLVEFLVQLCQQLDEDAVYVTRGDQSYLVTRDDPAAS